MEASKQQSLEDILADSPTLDDDALRRQWAERGHTEELSDASIAVARSRFAQNMSKSVFALRYVKAHPRCTSKDVQTAWSQAGGSGRINDTSVSRSRRELGLPSLVSSPVPRSAFVRSYLSEHPRAKASEICSAFEVAHPGQVLSDGLVYAVKRRFQENKSPPAAPPAARRSTSPTAVYESVERLLDEAISLCDRAGDVALAAELRRARRLVGRSILGANP